MNTQLAFAFGMLTMVAITMLVVIVIGMVKVIKQGKLIRSLETWISGTNDSIAHNISTLERVISDEVAILNRRIDEVYPHMDSRFDKFTDKITKKQLLKD